MPASIAVVIPASNAAGFIASTLETVAAQSVRPAEIIVVDDGSLDGTLGIVDQFAAAHPELNVRSIRQAHRGPGAARNNGIRSAASEWIAFLDSDDLWHANKIDVVAAAIAAHPDGNIVGSNEIIRYLDGSQLRTENAAGYDPSRPLPAQIYRRNLFSTSSVVCRRQLLVDAGGFDETLSSSQDYELWIRMSPGMRPVFLDDVLGDYIARRQSISTTRFFRRLWNKYRIAIRHRDKGGTLVCLTLLLRVTLYHGYQAMPAGLRGVLRRMTKSQ